MKGNRNGNTKKEFHGHRRTGSKNIRRQDDKSMNQFNSNDEFASRHMDDRLLYLIAKSIGSKAIVTVSSGARYKGILATADLEKNLSVILRFPELYSPVPGQDSSASDDELPVNLVIESKDMMDLEIIDVDLSTDTIPAYVPHAHQNNEQEVKQSFKTDTDISGTRVIEERELQKWVADDGLEGLSLEDDLSSNNNSTWDQFSVNEQKFGVESTYDEHFYTTRINRNAPDYERRLQQAEKIARDIESQGYNGNVHLAEERGIVIDDSGVDEEDKYSGVDRRGDELMAALKGKFPVPPVIAEPTTRSPGKYVPPGQRAAQIHNDPAIISSSALRDKAQSQRHSPLKSDEKPTPLPEFKTMAKPSSIPAKPPGTLTPTLQSKHKENKYPNEAIRLTAQSEINSLKEFSQNFKIPEKFSKDSNSKDKIKQEDSNKTQLETQKLAPPQSQSQTTTSSPIPPLSSVTSPYSNTIKPKKKMDPRAPAFKMNVQAAAFTPSSPSFNKSPAISNPSLNRNYPHRRYNMTPQSFFGGRLPKEDSKREFLTDFNLFVTIKAKADAKEETPVIERTFITPPTWEFTVDESYITIFQNIESANPVHHQQIRPIMYPPSSPMAMPHMMPMIPQMPYDANAPNFIPPGFMPNGGYPNYIPPNAFNGRGGNFNGVQGLPMAAMPGYQGFQRGMPQGYPNGGQGGFNYAPPNAARAPNPMSPQQNYSKFN